MPIAEMHNLYITFFPVYFFINTILQNILIYAVFSDTPAENWRIINLVYSTPKVSKEMKNS